MSFVVEYFHTPHSTWYRTEDMTRAMAREIARDMRAEGIDRLRVVKTDESTLDVFDEAETVTNSPKARDEVSTPEKQAETLRGALRAVFALIFAMLRRSPLRRFRPLANATLLAGAIVLGVMFPFPALLAVLIGLPIVTTVVIAKNVKISLR